MTNQKKQAKASNSSKFALVLKPWRQCGWGAWVLLGALFILSFICGANFEIPPRIYVAGQVAENDVISDKDLLVEDAQATWARKKQLQQTQPSVYDLSMEPYMQFQNRILDIFKALNTGMDRKHEPVLQQLDEIIKPQFSDDIFSQLSQKNVQAYIIKKLLPVIHDQLAEGLVGDVRASKPGRAGIFLRNLDTNTDILRTDVTSLPEVSSFLEEISTRLKKSPELNPQAVWAINMLLEATLPASLTLNMEATQKRIAEVISSAAPVLYQIQKGEVVLRKGEKASREQQIKMQALYNKAAEPIHWTKIAGAFICSLVLAIGLFISPSGKRGTPLTRKDLILISSVILFFGICAKGLYLIGLKVDSLSLLNSFALAFPVAGIVGLIAMVFAAKRYCTTGLLMSFFCMLMFQGEFSIFLYYFLGAMLATWLVTRAQNRQDVVWSIIPLFLGMLIIWSGCLLLKYVSMIEVPMQIIAILINALLSLILLFTVSPVIEMIFGYSTRFRLMELMSLEHPLMQEIMVNIPGTYHHSLVVAQMVEAGAKAIGANSLLCKVAALYHDSGKLTYPEYFIENQFGAPNKHDSLSPSMSSLILFSHVKKGTELAQKYKLGQEISDIIRQHHGTRIMKFFYQKAIDLGEKPNEADFSYPGPRPQTKEAAILMLADSVEASSRTLADPTPARIKNHIDKIIKGIFSEGQLDESELTFKDLHYLGETFQRILTGIFHQRVAYPETRIKAANQGEEKRKKEENKTEEKEEEVKKDLNSPNPHFPKNDMVA